jgi:hypothetical protein
MSTRGRPGLNRKASGKSKVRAVPVCAADSIVLWSLSVMSERYFETSANTGVNVIEVFESLFKKTVDFALQLD